MSNELRQHPDMVIWKKLNATARSKDIDAVERFPQVIASAGYQLVVAADV